MFRSLCAVDRKFLSEIFLGRVRICAIGVREGVTYLFGKLALKTTLL
ncbi:hypothetical protein QUB02_21915 [Microcoleus sp. D3_18_C1]